VSTLDVTIAPPPTVAPSAGDVDCISLGSDFDFGSGSEPVVDCDRANGHFCEHVQDLEVHQKLHEMLTRMAEVVLEP